MNAALIEDLGAYLAEYYPEGDPKPAEIAAFVLSWLHDRQLVADE